MVIATIDSLLALDWPAFEVVIVDNNTADPALWEPVEDYVRARLAAGTPVHPYPLANRLQTGLLLVLYRLLGPIRYLTAALVGALVMFVGLFGWLARQWGELSLEKPRA